MAYYPDRMKVAEIRDITRKDIPIYYRRDFSGMMVLELLGKNIEKRIEFSIETKPTGAKEIIVSGLDSIDYPLIPVLKSVKEKILDLDREGALP